MSSKLKHMRIRISGQTEVDLRKLYRARLWDLENKGRKAISFNSFLVYVLNSFERSADGALLGMIYNQELFEGDREEKRSVLEERKEASKASAKDW